jgi:hypothetical protein
MELHLRITVDQPELVKAVDKLTDQVTLIVTDLNTTNTLLQKIADSLAQIALNTKPEQEITGVEVVPSSPTHH